MSKFTVVIKIGWQHLYVNRHTLEEVEKIAQKVRETGRFNGFKATVERVGKILELK